MKVENGSSRLTKGKFHSLSQWIGVKFQILEINVSGLMVFRNRYEIVGLGMKTSEFNLWFDN